MNCMVKTVLCIALFVPSCLSEIARPRGVAIAKASLYKPDAEFHCLDGSAKVPYSYVNDDYCDCKDGSDEPGTSACPNGSFHCTNTGHSPLDIPSSRVDDGICDCCDGSDEPSGQCANMCRELGAKALEEAKKQKQLLEAGHKIFLEYKQQGETAQAQNKMRFEELEKEKVVAENEREEFEKKKLEAETPEKAHKEAHENAWKALVDEKNAERESLRALEAFRELDVDQSQMVAVSEMITHKEFDIDSSGEVSHEEAKEYLEDQDEVDFPTFKEKVWPNIKEIYKKPQPDVPVPEEGEPADSPAEHVEGHDGEIDENEDYDDDDMEEIDDEDDEEEEADGQRRGEENSAKEEEEKMPDYDEPTKLLIAVADEARNKFNEADKKVKDLEKEIKDLKKLEEIDFGKESEFYPLRGNCFEYTDREYVYKLCPFEKATQRGKSGGAETNLGTWGKWNGSPDSPYSAMLYNNGVKCWNGPERSVNVKISCGSENAILGASEPNRCEYEFKFTSPAACSVVPEEPEQKLDIHTEL